MNSHFAGGCGGTAVVAFASFVGRLAAMVVNGCILDSASLWISPTSSSCSTNVVFSPTGAQHGKATPAAAAAAVSALAQLESFDLCRCCLWSCFELCTTVFSIAIVVFTCSCVFCRSLCCPGLFTFFLPTIRCCCFGPPVLAAFNDVFELTAKVEAGVCGSCCCRFGGSGSSRWYEASSASEDEGGLDSSSCSTESGSTRIGVKCVRGEIKRSSPTSSLVAAPTAPADRYGLAPTQTAPPAAERVPPVAGGISLRDGTTCNNGYKDHIEEGC